MPSNGHINTNMLWLEITTILINAGIAWLLLRTRPGITARRNIGIQNAVLIFTGANLFLVLLFPPFESVFALTKAALPSFEGFYFIFNQKSNHVIVTTLLYIEAIFILFNGAVFWLLFKGHAQLTPAQMQALASQLRAKSGK